MRLSSLNDPTDRSVKMNFHQAAKFHGARLLIPSAKIQPVDHTPFERQCPLDPRVEAC